MRPQNNSPAGARPALIARLALDDAALDELARRVAVILAGEPAAPVSPWKNSAEAGEYLRCDRQRIFDLTSQGRLHVHKDGARNLYHRDELDSYLRGEDR